MKFLVTSTLLLLSVSAYSKTTIEISGITPGPGKVILSGVSVADRTYAPGCTWRGEEERNPKSRNEKLELNSKFENGKFRFKGILVFKWGKCKYKVTSVTSTYINPETENRYTLSFWHGKKPEINKFDLSTGSFDLDHKYSFYFDRHVQKLRGKRSFSVDFTYIGKTFRDKLNYFINHRDSDQARRLIQILSLNDLNKSSRHYAYDEMELAHLIVLNENAELLAELLKTKYIIKNNKALTHAIFYGQKSLSTGTNGLKLSDRMYNLLIQNSPDINAPGGLKMIPLHYALSQGDLRVVKLVLDHPEVDHHKVDLYGKTPKDYAIQRAKKDPEFKQFIDLF